MRRENENLYYHGPIAEPERPIPIGCPGAAEYKNKTSGGPHGLSSARIPENRIGEVPRRAMIEIAIREIERPGGRIVCRMQN